MITVAIKYAVVNLTCSFMFLGNYVTESVRCVQDLKGWVALS